MEAVAREEPARHAHTEVAVRDEIAAVGSDDSDVADLDQSAARFERHRKEGETRCVPASSGKLTSVEWNGEPRPFATRRLDHDDGDCAPLVVEKVLFTDFDVQRDVLRGPRLQRYGIRASARRHALRPANGVPETDW